MATKAIEIRRLSKAFAGVGIHGQALQRASTLSGGQQQRAAIARVLVQGAEVVLADEPIASLDPASAKRVMDILADINRTDGRTVVVSLHQVEYATSYCPRTVALRDGQIVFDGPSSALTHHCSRSFTATRSRNWLPASDPCSRPGATPTCSTSSAST